LLEADTDTYTVSSVNITPVNSDVVLNSVQINNIFVDLATNSQALYSVNTSTVSPTINYNVAYVGSPSSASIGYTSGYLTWAQWQSAGFDTPNSYNSNPLFVGSGAFTTPAQFAVQIGSPAINRGSTAVCGYVANLTDFNGNTICSGGAFAGHGWAPTMGAIQYGATSALRWYVDVSGGGSATGTGTSAASPRNGISGLNVQAGDLIRVKNSSGTYPTVGGWVR
jgi:hypothetical protein